MTEQTKATKSLAAINGALLIFMVVYLLTPILGLPRLYYFPTLDRWSFNKIDPIKMGYYGMLINAGIASAVGYLVLRFSLSEGSSITKKAEKYFISACIPTLAVAALYFIIHYLIGYIL